MAGYFDEAVLERSRNAARGERDVDLARNAYSRFLSQQRGQRNLDTVNDDWKQKWQTVGSSYGRRNMLHSGQYQQGLQRAAMQRFNAQNDARLSMQSDARQHDDQALSIQAAYQKAIADAELQVRLQQQQAAAQLMALRG